jgi:transposase-like protein
MPKKRTFTPAFKAEVVMEILTGKKTVSQVSREHGIKPSVVHRWRQEFITRAPELLWGGRKDEDPRDARIAELERLVGRLAMELEIAKKASRIWNSERYKSES